MDTFENTDIPLIEYVASKGKTIIISTSISDDGEINLALETYREVGDNQIMLYNIYIGKPN